MEMITQAHKKTGAQSRLLYSYVFLGAETKYDLKIATHDLFVWPATVGMGVQMRLSVWNWDDWDPMFFWALKISPCIFHVMKHPISPIFNIGMRGFALCFCVCLCIQNCWIIFWVILILLYTLFNWNIFNSSPNSGTKMKMETFILNMAR